MSSARRLLALGFAFCACLPIVFSLVPNDNERVIECGVGAPPGQELCPLGQCCSKYGFCGVDSDHCGAGCQSNCLTAAPKITCSTNTTRSIAYYESWATRRPCDVYEPSQIDPSEWTHVNFAFAILDDQGKVALSASNDTDLYHQLTHLRSKKKDLQVWLAVGGYSVAGGPFSKMASSPEARSGFIDSALRFVDTYGFDGIDIDWEYPGAPEKGGAEGDAKNFVALVKEMKPRMKEKGLSITIPGGGYYMKGFDLKAMEPHLDWVNVMTYDFHGPWDTPLVINPHTNLTEIHQSLQLLWNQAIPSHKVNLGLAYYGHTFTLANGECITPGCAATGPGTAGNCSLEAGSLIQSEIDEIVSENQITPEFDKVAAVKYFAWNETQWVSYDDKETLKMKKNYAAANCLGGTFVWADDMMSAD